MGLEEVGPDAAAQRNVKQVNEKVYVQPQTQLVTILLVRDPYLTVFSPAAVHCTSNREGHKRLG